MPRTPSGRGAVLRSVGAAATTSLLISGALALPAAAAPTPAPAVAADAPLTLQQAQEKARTTGKDVQATSATTENSTLTAHADGTFTHNQSLVPVRKRIGKNWVDLDPTLRRNADGSISTTTTASELTLSGGGKGPLAKMANRGHSLAVGLPMNLPAPTLSGATATYANVLEGVDLKVTADGRGSFSEVLVVKDAKAAANPALKKLTLSTQPSAGLKLTADAAGNITAADKSGQAAFTAPAPMMWDSATAPAKAAAQSKGTVKDLVTGRALSPQSGAPVESSATGPGDGAHAAPIATEVTADGINLVPGSLLGSADTTYPLYIDPTFYPSSASSSRQGWAQTNSYYPSQSFYNTNDVLRVGYNGWESPYFTARSYMQVSVDPALWDSTVLSSQINFTGVWSGSCTANNTELWLAPNGSKLSNATTWNNAPAPQTYVGSSNAMFWGGTNCDPRGVGFDIKNVMATAASGHRSSMVFVLKAQYENNDRDSWKKFANTVSISTTYNHAPDRSTSLSTSPATACPGGDYAGDGDVWLYGGVSDRNGGTLGATFHAVKHGTSTTIVPDSNPGLLTAQSGSTLAFKLPKANLESVAGGQLLQVDWTVTTTDFNLNGPTSTVCSFTFDPTRPGAPTITPPASSTVATSVPVTLTPACAPSCTAGNTPSSYQYQLNGGSPLTVAATNGNATIQVKPGRRTNTLTATSMSAGGNFGQTASVLFNSKAAAPAADGDLTGDGTPDLLTVGNTHGLPSGVWMAPGRWSGGNASVVSGATNLGQYGNGVDTYAVPSSFNGAQVISGQFSANNLQDVLAYYPATGMAVVLEGTGDGSPIPAQHNGTEHTITAGSFKDERDLDPSRLASAGNVSGNGTGYPDLLGISGDASNSYSLNLYAATSTLGQFQFPVLLNATTPTGGKDWNNWTIATAQMPSASGPTTAMFLWNKSTGRLDLWENLAADANGNLTHTSSAVATNWNTGQDIDLQAADVNADGTPDLWSVANGGNASLQVLNTGRTASWSSTGKLITAGHSWTLNDGTSGAVSTAADTAGSLPLTATAGANWNTGDLFSPDVRLNGSGMLATASAAITPTADYTVSAWAKPDALGGVVLSQDGALASSFTLWADAGSKTWRFQMPRTDVATPTQDIVTSGSTTADVGVWAHLTATYQASTGKETLYVNGVPVGTATHPSGAWATNKGLRVGAYLYNGTPQLKFNGQIANVQTWTQALSDSQVAALVGLPPAPTELQVATVTNSNNLHHTTRDSGGHFTAWDQVPDMAYNPGGGFSSVTQAEYQGNTYLAGIGWELQFQVRQFGSTEWDSPTGTTAPLSLTVPGTSVQITKVNASAIVNGDFDLIATGNNGRLYEALRHPNGVWVGWTDLTAKIAGTPGTLTEVAAATTTGGDLQLVAVSGGKLWHANRATAGGTWSAWGDVFANSSNPGTATHVAVAGVTGALQVMVTTNNGNSLYHAIRAATGVWTVFGDAGAAVGGVPAPIVSLAMAGVGTGASSTMQFVALTNAGTIYHAIRVPTGWTGLGNVTTYVQGTVSGTPVLVSAAGD
ncbi:LamG-like jellyroll fold domain-containing protein [Kitasatospora sp. NPDC048365]|uniref:LamG-like jellyroll fold domain-containing protein n=1 Tax=Kitasatospora sp. NPDC048365 TaxID=3364050 RepID=UPI00371B7B32